LSHDAICVFSQCTLITPPGTFERVRIAAYTQPSVAGTMPIGLSGS